MIISILDEGEICIKSEKEILTWYHILICVHMYSPSALFFFDLFEALSQEDALSVSMDINFHHLFAIHIFELGNVFNGFLGGVHSHLLWIVRNL